MHVVLKGILPVLLLLQGFAAHAAPPRYLFFLHNAYLEMFGPESAHKEYGKVEYAQVLDYFRKQGFVVMSEIRPRATDGEVYSGKIAGQIDSLLHAGAMAEDITVVGTSKGGYIAQLVCGKVHNPRVSYVFIGSCDGQRGIEGVHYTGRVLSIYESSDGVGRSCKGIEAEEKNKLTEYHEIELHTGLKHGFLFRALPGWMEPTAKWARHEKL